MVRVITCLQPGVCGAHALRRVVLDLGFAGAPVLIPDSSLMVDCVTDFQFNISHVLIECAQVRTRLSDVTEGPT